VERTGRRAWWDPHVAVVTGAGPVGLLAALLGVQRGLEVHVLDVATEGPKPAVTEAMGARYHSSGMGDAVEKARPDIIIEATGVPSVVFEAMTGNAAYGVVCLTGVSAVGRKIHVDVGSANREMVLENDVVVGSVNANLSHYAAAADALAEADTGWLHRLITRRLPLARFAESLEAHPDDIKVVLELQ
jgi:threonine dehydrogenase-like Zn-dependent dehydrogenase